jgi:ABC-type nitrate/sulfonate/bicarbonate transport system substrate-binding protein
MIAAAVIAVLALGGIGAWSFLASQALPPDEITAAWSPYESTALFWVAEDRQFLAENGLCVTLRRYETGAAALDGVVNGEAALAVGPSEFPLVRQAFRNASVRAIGCIDRGEFNYLVGRKDRGIGTAGDLRGKRVGTAVGTIAEFHLVRYLDLHGMTLADITLVDLETPAEWMNATADGDVDAISIAQPYVNAARDRLGENAVVWPLQSSQPLFALVIATDDWIETHPDPARRFLASLVEAEAYVAAHPAEARAIVQRRLDLDPGYMDTLWRQNRFSLSLDQSLVAAMEDEARWMIANNLTNATAIPDFGEYIDTTALEQVRPGSVRILG